MSSTPNNQPFGRYTREDCGLPAIGSPLPDSGLSFWKGFLLFLLLAAAGWFAGQFSARQRANWVAELPARIHYSSNDQIPGLLEKGKHYATALPDNHVLRCNLAYAVIVASEHSPRRLGFLANAANLFRGLDLDQLPGSLERFNALLTASGTYADLGDYDEAFRSLDEAEKELQKLPEKDSRPYRLILINAKAYFLAEAPSAQGGDAKQAAQLATLVISSRDRLPTGRYASDSAAFLDTLALARYKTGDRAGAMAAQSLALGLAENTDLVVYLNHYDDFNTDIHNRNRKSTAAGIVDSGGAHRTYLGGDSDPDEAGAKEADDTQKNPGTSPAGQIHGNTDNNARGTNASIPE